MKSNFGAVPMFDYYNSCNSFSTILFYFLLIITPSPLPFFFILFFLLQFSQLLPITLSALLPYIIKYILESLTLSLIKIITFHVYIY